MLVALSPPHWGPPTGLPTDSVSGKPTEAIATEALLLDSLVFGHNLTIKRAVNTYSSDPST